MSAPNKPNQTESNPSAPEKATKEAPFVNSLGMKFVPAGTPGVLFSIWDVRVKDFARFIQDSGYDMSKGKKPHTGWLLWKQECGDWRDPAFPKNAIQNEDHPVVCVSWEDAKAFCAWLTKEDRAAGLLSGRQTYRLPGDHEWSVAVGIADSVDNRNLFKKMLGIGGREWRLSSPEMKHSKIKGVYPWGTQWPPPNGAGNFADETAKRANIGCSKYIDGYDDGFAYTSPVGSFMPNRYGLYDMAGNVWQWCEDWYNQRQISRTLRGGSWDTSVAAYLRSSSRLFDFPLHRTVSIGIRCVLAVSGS